ncbi:MAG: LysR family transcriptional regulator [Ruminococcaceae bacterium]|nr:LysR family transcriptional regulator [Oscillospiraceae bacterium]
MIDIKIKTLLAVVEQGSFTKAAKQLSLTQPAISHHINALEEELERKIFIRGKSDLKLTPDGEIIVKYAKRMNSINDKLISVLSNPGHALSNVRIGITHTSESNLITEVLAKYSRKSYGASITIITDTISNLYNMLENYELDLAIVDGKPSGKGLRSLMLDTDYLVCVLANENPLAKKEMVTLKELKKEKMILRLPSSATRMQFEAQLERIDENISDFDVIIEVDNIATIKDLIRKNLGVSILAKSACMDEVSKNKITVLPIENLSMIRETNIVYHKDFDNNDILEKIMKIYRDTKRTE